MPKVRKGNRILTVKDSRLASYLKYGYDEINAEGKVIKRATGGKTVTVGEYNAALDKIEHLEAEIEQMGDDKEATAEIEKLRDENEKLKAENKSLKAAAKKGQTKEAADPEGAKEG